MFQQDTHRLLDWFKNNSMEANPTKFQSMILKNKKAIADYFNIIVNDTMLNLTDDMTVLGITIDSQLNFNVHVSNVCNKAGRQLNVLQRLKGSLDYSSRLSLYKSLIMSNLTIAPAPWYWCSPQNFHFQSSRAFKSGLSDLFWMIIHQGAVSIRKTVLPGMAIPMLKIRRPNGRLIFNMENAIRR